MLANPFGLFIIGLSAILLLLEDLWVYAKGGKTAFGNIWKNFGTPEEVMQGFKRVGTAITNLMKFVGKLFSGQGLGKTTKFLLILVGGIAALIVAIGWIPVAIAAAIGLLIAYWDEIEAMFNSVVEWFKQTGKSISDFFDSIGDAMSNAMSTAANTAKNAWNGFISWLEEKWDWIKSLLPSLSSIASKLPSLGNSISLAAKDNGGSNSSSTVYDQKKVDLHFYTAESAKAGVKQAGLTPYVDSGVK